MMSFLLIIYLTWIDLSFSREPLPASRFSQLSGANNKKSQKALWDKKYSRHQFVYGKAPALFLANNFHYIPKGGKVLDVGMGEGRNAVFLAQKGFKVTGIDISSVALKKTQILARENKVSIQGVLGSFKKYQFQEKSFDAIIVFYYVDRSLIPKIKKLLKPGGVIIYEAFTIKESEKEQQSSIEEYLKPRELLGLFGDMTLLKYAEPQHESRYRQSIIVKKD